MKKKTTYILIGLIAVSVTLLMLTDNRSKSKKFDERVTLKKEDKLPYGAFIAFRNLKHLFPNATISVSKKMPGYWDTLSMYTSGQALIILARDFYADEYEMKTLIRFIENGNDVFISSRTISSQTERIIRNITSAIALSPYFIDGNGRKVRDTLALQLDTSIFNAQETYSYKGTKFSSWFYQMDSATTRVLGHDPTDHPNFIHLKAGKGNLYVHLAPLAFSNYFLLQGDNLAYYESVLSVIPRDTRRVVWDEYFLEKKKSDLDPYNDRYGDRGEEGDSRGFLSELFRYEELKWALIVAIGTLLLFTLLEMRRRQRYIPELAKPKNDSLDFVKTIGRLYFDKGDHRNLAKKMAAYFLEHVRNTYKLPTGTMDDAFVEKLKFKSGGDEEQLKHIVGFISYLDGIGKVSDKQLVDFHKRLESFYQNTK